MKTAESKIKLGKKLELEGKLDEAIQEYKKALEIDPKCTKYYSQLANLLQNMGQQDELISCYRNAIAQGVASPQFYVKLGDIFRQRKQIEEALSSYLKAIELDPTFSQPYHKLLKHPFPKKQVCIDRALQVCQNIFANYPKKLDLPIASYLAMASLLTARGSLEEAISYYKQAGYKKYINKRSKEIVENSWQHNAQLTEPHFMIIGVGKCGTTSLSNYMDKHPQIILSIQKEIRFFDNLTVFKHELGKNWYLAHFPPIASDKNLLTGEATPWYFSNSHVPARIYHLFPNVKTILIFRNPVDRALSHYHSYVVAGIESRSFEEVVRSEIKILKDIADPTERTKSWNPEKSCIATGIYIGFLEKWMSVFPKENFLILNHEDLKNNPEMVMNQIFDFLGVSSYKMTNYKKHNARSYSPMNDDARLILSEFYKPHNQKLEEFLDTKLNWR